MASEQQHLGKTSLLSYCQEEESGRMGQRQREVLDCIRKNPNHTATEIARLLKYADPNKVRPRICDLEDAGIIERSWRRACRVTDKLCYTWRVKPE